MTEDFETTLERASLLQDRYYIVIRDGDEEGTVRMTAYDTTPEMRTTSTFRQARLCWPV